MEYKKIQNLVSKMTLEEKASMCSGEDFWHTKAVDRLGIPSIMMSDGPYGLRKQEKKADHLGINESIKAVCFPSGVATASSFDRNLKKKLGETLGDECQMENVALLLGPAMNIKRSPLCGRNFEYYSEDPYVSSQMAEAYIKGIQSRNVGACPKHFYANNMEEKRMTASSEVDERTRREIYLASFEDAIKQARPWSVMCSYNKINGIYAAENEEALTSILRDEWGFDGFVVSDWGAVNDRVLDLKAGMDLEMPGSEGINDSKIVEAVRNGTLDEAVLNRTCERILQAVFRYEENHKRGVVINWENDHEISRRMAEKCMVLLKNEGVLPLQRDKKIAVIGKYALNPRFQGGGSSHINSYKVTSFMDSVAGDPNIIFAQGFDDGSDETKIVLLQEAINTAKEADTAVIFAGLPAAYESEGYDRKHMNMPPNQNRLIEEICKVQDNVVVVLHNGSPIEMPWVDREKGILESYLGGEAVGEAQKNILFGNVNPCGKLAETFPIKLEDNPSYLSYQVKKDKVNYQEGVFVGYRYYDTKKMDVLFPFGHGLSYTSFEYSDLKTDKDKVVDNEKVQISVKVKNTGCVSGEEIVQLYVTPVDCDVIRPAKELKGFEKVSLESGEEKTVYFILDKRAFAYWDTDETDWRVEEGNYGILVGASSRDIRQETKIFVTPEKKKKKLYTGSSTFGEIMKDSDKSKILFMYLDEVMKKVEKITPDKNEEVAISAELIQSMIGDTPIETLFRMIGDNELQKFLDDLNKE